MMIKTGAGDSCISPFHIVPCAHPHTHICIFCSLRVYTRECDERQSKYPK